MGFTSTYGKIPARAVWNNDYYNQLVADLETKFDNITGTDLKAGITLSKTNQNLDGDGHSIGGFKSIYGHGGSTMCVIVATAYGTGSGSSDHTAALQRAIDDLPSSGGCILFPPGVYNLAGTLYMAGSDGTKSNVMLMGFGERSVLRVMSTGFANGARIKMGSNNSGSPAEGMVIQGIRIDNANSVSGYMSGLSMDNTLASRVVLCSIDGMDGSGVHIGGALDGSIFGCHIANCTTYNVTIGGAAYTFEGHGIHHGGDFMGGSRLAEAHRVKISGCKLYNNAADGIRLGPGTGYIVESCTCRNNTGDGIRIETYERSGVSGSIVRNNVCGENYYGICLVTGYEVSGTYKKRAGTQISGVIVSSNDLHDNANDGLHVRASDIAQVKGCVFSDNGAYNNGENGINFKYGSTLCSVTSNSCSNNLGGGGAGAGIAVQDCTKMSLAANVCFDDGAGVQDYGILLDADTEDCVAIGNQCDGNVTADLLDLAATGANDVSHNKGA